ncbi:hypothetical protein SXIM_29630 [Streptomyces xiamenensis]|uniref:Uncharacterized protein n=1 Tax=Streptomyces xiamenensis TaxID=408015 RepID=A0A0F7FWH7_9ACTN|nr:hypothetical protein SXIM_29630 [Streptomyces xiamenensis]
MIPLDPDALEAQKSSGHVKATRAGEKIQDPNSVEVLNLCAWAAHRVEV